MAGRLAEHAERLLDTYFFSRQGEYAPDEALAYGQPVADFAADGRLFMKWNRNRVNSAQDITGVPSLTHENREAVEALDRTVRHPDMMFRMYLEPGDLQIMNNLDMQHSRTAYVDYDEPECKRLTTSTVARAAVFSSDARHVATVFQSSRTGGRPRRDPWT